MHLCISKNEISKSNERAGQYPNENQLIQS